MLDRRALATFCAHDEWATSARAPLGGDDWTDLSTPIATWTWAAKPTLSGVSRFAEEEGYPKVETVARLRSPVINRAHSVAKPATNLATISSAPLIDAPSPGLRTDYGDRGHHRCPKGIVAHQGYLRGRPHRRSKQMKIADLVNDLAVKHPFSTVLRAQERVEY